MGFRQLRFRQQTLDKWCLYIGVKKEAAGVGSLCYG